MQVAGTICLVLAALTVPAAFIQHVLRWKRGAGPSAAIPCLTGVLVAAGVALASDMKPSAMGLLWLFLLSFLACLVAGGPGAALACRLLRVARTEVSRTGSEG